MIRKRLAIAGALVASLFVIPLEAGAGRDGASKPSAAKRLQPVAAREARSISLRARLASPGVPTYMLVDVGSPTSSTYGLSDPVALNNNGQIAGNAHYFASADYYGPCIIFDGKKYRELTPSANIVNCTVNGMSAENVASGAVHVAANATTVFSSSGGGYYGDEKAVLSTLVPSSGSIATTVFPNDESFITGVNDAGTAVGVGVYQPITGFATSNSPFITTAGKSALSVLQPSCTIVRLGCAGFPTFTSSVANSCGFGGCNITADGTLFLIDLFTGSFELVKPDGTTQDIALDADVLQTTGYGIGAPIINDANQILYAVASIVAGATVIAPQIYQIGVGPIVTVPPIKGNSCLQYIPLSFNNVGEVVGIAYSCVANNPTYFTYDPANGTRDLSSELPTSGFYSLQPEAVNDNGQILVGFETTNGGPVHWGLLDPMTAAAATHGTIGRISARARRTARLRTTHLEATSENVLATASLPRPGIANDRPQRNAPLASKHPPPLHLRPRAALASAPSYSILDYGSPSRASYTAGEPVAFNNTGQIVGAATDVPYIQSSTCILFDGVRFRNITAATSVVNCQPMSINDLNLTTGALEVVGTVVSAFSFGSPGFDNGTFYADYKAFVSKIAPKANAVDTIIFAANDDSDLTGINAAGSAVGVGVNALDVPDDGTGGLFHLAPGSHTIAPLKTSCTTVASACDGYLLQEPCAFGGCNITADGTIYLNFEIVSPDGTARPFKLPDYEPYRPIINSAGELLYQDIPKDDARPATPIYYSDVRLYSIATGLETKIPKLPGNTCDNYEPLSFNRAGTIIGYVGDCPTGTEPTYFIYDATNGTRDLIAMLPSGNAAIAPIGINDNGQILIGITLGDGSIDWGILQPSATANGRRPATVRPVRERP
jgi:hypothetical protein